MEGKESVGDHVRYEHTGNTEREAGVRRDLGQGLCPAIADRGDHMLVASGEPGLLLAPARAQENRLQGDVSLGFGTATGDRIWTDQRTARVLPCLHRPTSPPPNSIAASGDHPAGDTACLGAGTRDWPTRSTS